MPMKTRVGFRIKLAFMYQISILKSIVLSVLQLSTPDSNRQSPWTEGSKGLCFGKCVHSWCCYKPTSITTHLCLSTHNSLLQLLELFVLENPLFANAFLFTQLVELHCKSPMFFCTPVRSLCLYRWLRYIPYHNGVFLMVSEFIMAVKVIFEIICWKNFLNLIFF